MRPAVPTSVAHRGWTVLCFAVVLTDPALARNPIEDYVRVSLTQRNTVLVEWRADATNLIGFNVFRATNPDSSFLRVNPFLIAVHGPEGQYEDVDVQPATTYWYHVQWVDRIGGMGLLNRIPVSITTLGATPVESTSWGTLKYQAARCWLIR